MTVEEVQDRFSECFPFLKIEFYSKAHKRFEATDREFMYSPKQRLVDVRKNHYAGAFEIKSWYSVAKVEESLEDIFGLYVQIFRTTAGGHWVQTSLSDALTLQEQTELSCCAY